MYCKGQKASSLLHKYRDKNLSVSIFTHKQWNKQQKENTRKCSFRPSVYVCAVLTFFIWKTHRQGVSETQVACGLERLPKFRGNCGLGHANTQCKQNLRNLLKEKGVGGIKEAEGFEMGRMCFLLRCQAVNKALQELLWWDGTKDMKVAECDSRCYGYAEKNEIKSLWSLIMDLLTVAIMPNRP